jgi:hypothetical protein
MKSKLMTIALVATTFAGITTLSPLGHALCLELQEQNFAGDVAEKQLNFHWNGIGIRVPNPQQLPGHDRRISVIDLGPGIKDLIDDRAPVRAEAIVNGNPPLPFRSTVAGVLVVKIQAELLNSITHNEIAVRVFDINDRQLVNAEMSGLFF